MSASLNTLFSGMDQKECQYCEGTLERGTYKSEPAVVCDECGTPALRVW